MIEELLANPEQYRSGENYRATNIVFPVEFSGEKFIIKKPRILASLINAYYVFQDQFFYGTRQLSTARQRFQLEAEKLERLDGLRVPRLVIYENGILVREFLEGRDFRNLESDGERKKTLEGAIESLAQFHERDIVAGDAHVKNTFLTEQGTYWIDLDGEFKSANIVLAKAIDLLKFVYSTYSATRDEDATLHAAELISKYPDGGINAVVKYLVSPGFSATRLWFPTRITRSVNKEIKKVLLS